MARVPNLRGDLTALKNLKSQFTQRAGVNHWAYDGVTRIISDNIAKEIGVAQALTSDAFESYQLAKAIGDDLDSLGQEMGGVNRLSPTFATIEDKHKNLMFYSTQGNFGNTNGGNDVIIPAGTIVSSENVSESIGVKYEILENYTIPWYEDKYYCSARAVNMGTGSNIGSSVLVNHDFKNYSRNGEFLIKCTNRYPVLNGRNTESDESFRYRISQRIPSIVQNNIESIRMSGLIVPGVLDLRIMPGYYGIGTVAVFVFGADGESSKALTEAVQTNLMQNQTPGLKIMAVPGVKIKFDFDIRVRTERAFNKLERDVLIRKVKKQLYDKLKSYESSSILPLGKIAIEVTEENPDIISMLSTDVSAPNFEAVYVTKFYADTPGHTGDRSKVIQSFYSLGEEEFCSLGHLNIKFEADI